MCMIAFAASTTDDYDFHPITTQIDKLSWYYNLSLNDVSCCLAVSLVTRYVGTVIVEMQVMGLKLCVLLIFYIGG